MDAVNLADPSFEPSDEELAGLTKRAFAPVWLAEEKRRLELRQAIAVARAEALRRLRNRVGGGQR